MSKKNRPKRKRHTRQFRDDEYTGFGFGIPSMNPIRPRTRQTKHQQIQSIIKRHPEVRPVITEFLMGQFYMRPEVAIRFAEYARAAAPNEIGGFLRVQKSGKNFIATDLMVFPQTAHSTFFEMDGRTRATWQKEMKKQGRKDELAEWNCLIHSHPEGCPPFLSGTDEDQIKELGHRRHFWSVIVTAGPNIMALDWRVHYYHGGMAPGKDGMLEPTTPPVLVKDMTVDLLPSDWKEIHEEVRDKQGANAQEFVGKSEARRPTHQAGRTNSGIILPGSYNGTSISDLSADDVPNVEDSGAWSDEDLEILREAGIDAAQVQAAIDSEFVDDELLEISEGSIVCVTDKAIEVSVGGEDADEIQDTIRDMVDSEFTVEEVTDEGMVVMNDGISLPASVLLVVQP